MLLISRLLLLLIVECALIAVSAMVPFETIEQGQYSGIKEDLTEVYLLRQDFNHFWERHGSNTIPPPNAPDVNFDSRMVIAVFMGEQVSGGYSVSVTSLEMEGDKLVVNYETAVPPPGAMVTMALTQPYHVISVDREEASAKTVVFEGSAKPPPPPPFPTFILTFADGTDKDAIVQKIKGFVAVKNVRMLTSLGIAMVDFDSEQISKDEALKLLKDLEGVASVEEDSPMGF